MREKAKKMESEKVAVRREDKTIRHSSIPTQEGLVNEQFKNIVVYSDATHVANFQTHHNISGKKNNTY